MPLLRSCVLIPILLSGCCWAHKQNTTFRLAFIGSSPISIFNRGPACSLALEDFLATGSLSEYEFELMHRVGCGAKDGVGFILDMYKEYDIDVVFGPVCSAACESMSYLLSHWNLPFLSHSCSDPALAVKSTHNTLIRTRPSYGKVGAPMLDLFEHYGWKRAVLMIREEFPCGYGADGIEKLFKENNITIGEWIKLSRTDPPNDKLIDYYLSRVKDRGRVIIICHTPPIEAAIMARAHAMGMTNGDFVFIAFAPLAPSPIPPWSTLTTPNSTEEELKEIRSYFHSYKKITVSGMSSLITDAFKQRLEERGLQAPWNFTLGDFNRNADVEVALYLYDAVYLYLLILNETITTGGEPRNNGDQFFQIARDQHFKGVAGTVRLDENADREPDYLVWQLTPDSHELQVFAELPHESQGFTQVADPYWGTADGNPPLDTPVCGFSGEFCLPDDSGEKLIISVCIVTVVVVAIMAGGLYLRRQKRIEEELRQMAWKVKYEDLDFAKSGVSKSAFFRSVRSLTTAASSSAVAPSSAPDNTDASLTLAIYKGTKVVVRPFKKDSLNLTKMDLIELGLMREMSHDNINPFLGACVNPPNICVLGQYCSKGTLQDILENEEIRLDWLFKKSIMSDLVNGMSYIHNSQLKSHGRLRSSNCLVDSRWVLKITSFGLHAFRQGELRERTQYKRHWEMLWTAPELLRMEAPPAHGTQSADVYSYAIILQELLFRASPFFEEASTPGDTLEKVRAEQGAPFRPDIPKVDDPELQQVVSLMKDGWAEKPGSRPTFSEVKKRLRVINKGRKINIMDNMLQMLEKYANNLEEIVEQRTEELIEEKKKTDTLLYRMMPESVAEKLKTGKALEAELYSNVTVYFSDIVGFTQLSSLSTPIQVVNLLNDLYSMFDDTLEKHDVYKVETIGDAYMVASGLPKLNGRRHVAEIANMALDLLKEVALFKIRHMPDRRVQLRIGMHTGPCAAGVVGLRMPRYCLFGDTVNTASRMESNGEAGKIHLSQASQKALNFFPLFNVSLRGEVEIKGKGKQTTYWLTHRDDEEQGKSLSNETL